MLLHYHDVRRRDDDDDNDDDDVQEYDDQIIQMIPNGMVVDVCISYQRIPCCHIRRPWRYRY